MNKKEVAEIKKLFKPETTAITSVVTALVRHTDAGTKIQAMSRRALLSMDDEEMAMYLDTGKNTLGGKLEKNLLNISFPNDEANNGGCENRLYNFNKSCLTDDAENEKFIKAVADNYDTAENFMIQLMHGEYDIPVKSKNKENTGESEDVYSYTVCAICPLKPQKSGICLTDNADGFETIKAKLAVEKPEYGFLFPAFNDRSSDINQILFFTKKSDEIHPEFITAMTGANAPIPADAQKKIFEDIIKQVAEGTDFENTKNIHGDIRARIDEKRLNDEDTHITKADIQSIISSNIGSIPADKFERAYKTVMAGYDDSTLALENIVDTTKFDVDVPDIKIKVKPDKTENIEQKTVDGRKCFVIPVSGNVEVNGIALEK